MNQIPNPGMRKFAGLTAAETEDFRDRLNAAVSLVSALAGVEPPLYAMLLFEEPASPRHGYAFCNFAEPTLATVLRETAGRIEAGVHGPKPPPEHRLVANAPNPHARHYHLLGLEAPAAGKVPDRAAKSLLAPHFGVVTIGDLCSHASEVEGPIDEGCAAILLTHACRSLGLRPGDSRKVAAVVAEVLAAPEPDHDSPRAETEKEAT